MDSGIKKQLDFLFNPGTIAVIGASNNKMKWGYIIAANIVTGGFTGKVYPVNPREEVILEREVKRSIKEIPEQVDLALITIPAPSVIEALRECIEARVRSCIVISGGFSETDEEGAKLEREIVDLVKGSGMRLVGPNTMGVYSSSCSLHALMPPVRPVRGKIGFAAQSGNLGTQMLSLGRALGVGFSRFVCIGNEADLTCTDYLEYFTHDPSTEVILLYIEGLRQARRFVSVAREASKVKPVIVMKAGKTEAGARAARSHSAAMAADETIFRGVMKQTGIIEAADTEEMLDIAKAFAALPLPKGKRVGVLTWGGGWGVVATDALARHGLELARFPEEVLRELDQILPPYWSRGNPVDLVGTLDISKHFKCVELISRCETVDAVVSLGTMGATSSFQSFVMEDSVLSDVERDKMISKMANDEFLESITETETAYRNEVISLMEKTGKPILAVSFPTSGATTPMLASQSEVVIYPSPERSAKALASLYQYKTFKEEMQKEA
ncbi:MAG: CoA-binding protein [Actinomycetota bacterium]|nr:CoA-binding protein [Actinomycetota bacterium]